MNKQLSSSFQLSTTIFIYYTVFEAIHGNVMQLHPVLSVHEGDTAVFSCFIKTTQISRALWYKQVTGEQPHLLSSFLLRSSSSQFHSRFDNSRFNVSRGTDSLNLTIVNTVRADSATYFCALSFSNFVEFGNGTRLVIKEIRKPAILQPPKFELVETDEKVPLQCSVKKELVRGEHHLYWFQHGSGESPEGSVYVHGNTSDECLRRSEDDCLSPKCTYNLPKDEFISPEAHFCALATCGEALFAHVSQLNPDSNVSLNIQFIEIGLAALLAISFTINILLCCLRKNGRKCCEICSTVEDGDGESINPNRELTYASVLHVKKPSRVKRISSQEDTLQVYSGLACQLQS